MKHIADLERTELRDVINKNWMTHDGMWFFHSTMKLGVEKTNEINLAAVRSMGQIEAKRLKKALGLDDVKTFADLKAMISGYGEIIRGEFMKYTFEFPEYNVMRVEWEKGQCFAYQGVKKLGVLDGYTCGIYARIDSWFESLGVKFEARKLDKCYMIESGECVRDYRFFFES